MGNGRQYWKCFAMAALLMLSTPAHAQMATLTGEVTYSERIALPEAAALRIRLVDLTVPDMPARVEVAAPIESAGQVPLSFTLNFDSRVVDPAHEYGLIAEIVAGSAVHFRNDAPHRLDPLRSAEPITVMTRFLGRLIQPEPAPSAASVPTDFPLDTTWRATAINGEPVAAGRQVTLSIGSDRRAGGSGACNSYFAQAALSGQTLHLSALGATRLACSPPATMDLESRFFAALQATRRWSVENDVLTLLDANVDELVRFVRVMR